MRWLLAPAVLLAVGWTGAATAWRSWAKAEWAEAAELDWLRAAAAEYRRDG